MVGMHATLWSGSALDSDGSSKAGIGIVATAQLCVAEVTRQQTAERSALVLIVEVTSTGRLAMLVT